MKTFLENKLVNTEAPSKFIDRIYNTIKMKKQLQVWSKRNLMNAYLYIYKK